MSASQKLHLNVKAEACTCVGQEGQQHRDQRDPDHSGPAARAQVHQVEHERARALREEPVQHGHPQRRAARAGHEVLDQVHVGELQAPVAQGRQQRQVRAHELPPHGERGGHRALLPRQEPRERQRGVARGVAAHHAVGQQHHEQHGDAHVRPEAPGPLAHLHDGLHLQQARGQHERGRCLQQEAETRPAPQEHSA